MKKYLVVGSPIEHSLSPKLHNYWIKKNNINAIYEKKNINVNEIENLILGVKQKKISGLNVTVPYKKEVINYLDDLSSESNSTQSVNTVFLDGDKLIGHNTDISGFELSIKEIKFNITDKKVLILGAGGVVPSIIFALNKMKPYRVIVTNRTKSKAEDLKNLFNNLTITDWGDLPDFDMIINATSVGLKKEDKLNLDFSKIGKNKLFYDIIYNPKKTNFLKTAKEMGNKVENGKKMFIYQAAAAFKIWHGIQPAINEKVIKFIDK